MSLQLGYRVGLLLGGSAIMGIGCYALQDNFDYTFDHPTLRRLLRYIIKCGGITATILGTIILGSTLGNILRHALDTAHRN